MDTIQQMALDSGYNSESKVVDIVMNSGSLSSTSVALDSADFIRTLTTKNPVGQQTRRAAFGMDFHTTNQPLILDESPESFNLKNRAEAAIDAMLNPTMALDDTYAYNIPSSGIPNVLSTIWTTRFFKQMFQSTPFREMTTPDQQGMFGTTDVRYPMIAASGDSKLYSDFGGTSDSSINLNYLQRQTVTLQRVLSYGDMQVALMGMAKVDYVGWLREYIATLITLDQNNIGFNGYSGMQCFGLLNDPSLNATLPAGSGQWMVSGTYASVCSDIITTVQSIQTIGAGQVDTDKEFIIGLPPVVFGALLYQNSFGLNVRSYIESVYPKCRFIQVQNYTGTGTPLGSDQPNFMQVIFKEIMGQDTALGVFSTLYNSHGVVRMVSSYNEKVSYVVAGTVLTVPLGVATMSGI